MKIFVKIAGVASALTLAYAAYADTFNVTLGASVPGFCTITGTPSVQTGGASPTLGNNSATFNYTTGIFPNYFADTTGHGIAGQGSVALNVTANAQCDYTLKSANGALWNSAANFARGYSADVYRHPGSGSLVPLTTYLPGRVVNGFSIEAPTGGHADHTVIIEFSFSGGSSTPVLATGQYLDTLTLTINPA